MQTMQTKSFDCKVKAAGPDDGLGEGEYRALVSVFGNRDYYGDVVQPGAFTETIDEWKKSGDPIPVYWSHRLDDPDMNIGYVIEAKETDKGLEVHAKLDLENPKAMQVYRLLKGRRVTQHSFTYDILDAGPAELDEQEIYELRKLKLHEVGPTPIGANQDTELLAVKHRKAAVSDKPWSDFTQADYSPEQWRRSCLIDTEQGEEDSKDRYKIPVREPDGTLNRNGCHAAAGGHGIGAVTGVSDEKKQAAAKKLVSLYRNQLDEDPHESLVELAGMSSDAEASDGKSAGPVSKAGRVLSSKNEKALRDAQVALESAAAQIKDVLSALDALSGAEEENENGKATANPPAKDEEPIEAKSEEPAGCSPARVRLAAELIELG